MNDGQARALAALDNGALTAVEIADRAGLTGEQVSEHLRHLTHIGFVRGNSARPRVWGMTGLARGWANSTATGPGVQA
ncbi:helix-turn-helix domain-containing protein [Nocardia salmonicida]|uniref:helix-turn-helix domain-containing protein n=1 Tax=Nocardia salmonicida TaxID=53431 RepID=UPI002E29EF46|nr:hypothetical protein [Nocardia salmonicida]